MAVTNLPLSQRGNIDAELEAYKREVAAQAKAGDRVRIDSLKEIKAEAKSFAHLLPDMAKWQADKTGHKLKDVKSILDGWMKWEPRRYIKAVKEYQSTL